eukprot:3120154-Rhodomonas_salina.2
MKGRAGKQIVRHVIIIAVTGRKGYHGRGMLWGRGCPSRTIPAPGTIRILPHSALLAGRTLHFAMMI